MMKAFLLLVLLAAPLAAGDADLARAAVAGLDVAALKAELTQAGQPAAEVEAIASSLTALQSGDAQVAAGPTRESIAALGRELSRRKVPERAIHPLLWKIQDRRFPRVDPTPLYAQLKAMSLDPAAIQRMADGKIRIYAKERTDVAEAQYEFISNSLYLPPDYLEPNAHPPRLKSQLTITELNTVIHELDHAEKDLLTDDTEAYDKSLLGAMVGGIRKVAFPAVGAGFLGLALSAIPHIAKIAPVVGLSVMGALVVGGAAYGAYQWYKARDKNPRDERQTQALAAVSGIADVIRRDPKQKHLGVTEARSKAWEVSGYYMGDAMTDINEQIDSIKLEQHRKIRQAKTPEEVEAIVANLQISDALANRRFGDSARGGDAWFRVKPVEFDYKSHPELFYQLYGNSLGLQPPRDNRELVARINADPTLFPQLRTYIRMHADRRLKELAPPDRATPNFTDVPVTR